MQNTVRIRDRLGWQGIVATMSVVFLSVQSMLGADDANLPATKASRRHVDRGVRAFTACD